MGITSTQVSQHLMNFLRLERSISTRIIPTKEDKMSKRVGGMVKILHTVRIHTATLLIVQAGRTDAIVQAG